MLLYLQQCFLHVSVISPSLGKCSIQKWTLLQGVAIYKKKRSRYRPGVVQRVPES